MTTPFDVPADVLLDRVSATLREGGKAPPPAWARFARTGMHTERAPQDPAWWYRRLAAVLRKVYMLGPIGTARLAAEFGGTRDGGSAPYHPRRGSGKVTRGCLQQLEALGLVSKADTKGRVVTPAGRKMLDGAARAILLEMAAKNPELTKYTRAK